MKKIHLINKEYGKSMYRTFCGQMLYRKGNEKYFTRSDTLVECKVCIKVKNI